MPRSARLFRRLAGWLGLVGVVGQGAGLADAALGPRLTVNRTATNTVVLNWSVLATAQGYRVEYRDTLGANRWQPCPLQDQWPQMGTNWLDPRPFNASNRFYRIMALETMRGKPVASNLMDSFTLANLLQRFATSGVPVTPQNAVDTYRVVYDTITPDGAPTRASGALLLPRGLSRALPLLSYQHGTVVLTNKVASQKSGEYDLGLGFASLGYVVSMPDYLGMGLGTNLHPYIHARSEATAAVDLLRASRVICTQQSLTLNGQLFLIGYSQGGQATMALHREIETHHSNEFAITASAPMAGPYDMSGTMVNLMVSDQPYITPYYLPYTLFSYNSVYRFFTSASEVLTPPYDTTLPPLFDGRHSEAELTLAMPSVPSQIFRPEYLAAFRNDPNHPLRDLLRANDLYRWTPRAPMCLYHCHGDTTVPYANSQVASNNFFANGVTIPLNDPYTAGNHATGSPFCFLAAKSWFDTLKQ